MNKNIFIALGVVQTVDNVKFFSIDEFSSLLKYVFRLENQHGLFYSRVCMQDFDFEWLFIKIWST